MLLVEGIDVYYGDVQVLNGVTLDVKDKEFVVVIGANGAGKTTLLKTISGLRKPRRGSITFDGNRTSDLESYKVVCEGIVQVPEGRLLFPEMTVQENLDIGGFQVKEKGVRVVGPALIQSWASASGFVDSHPAGIASSFNFNRTSTDIGLVAEAGVRFMALKNISLDVAFRYRWTQPNYAFTTSPGPGPVNVKLGIRDAHLFNALVRASYHF